MSETKTRGAGQDKAPKSCKECQRWKDAKESARETRLLEVLGTAINKIEETFTAETYKPTVGDYMKLMQMEKELSSETDEAKEIRVTWVERTESEKEA
jgi:hypothetical protein